MPRCEVFHLLQFTLHLILQEALGEKKSGGLRSGGVWSQGKPHIEAYSATLELR